MCDLDPKVKVIGQKAGICDGVPSTSALVLSCIHVNHLCILYLYYFLVVVHRGPHGRLAFFFLLNVLPSENKDYYYYYYYY